MESADYRLHVAAAAIIARNAGAPCPMLPDGLVCSVSSLAFRVVLSALSLGVGRLDTGSDLDTLILTSFD